MFPLTFSLPERNAWTQQTQTHTWFLEKSLLLSNRSSGNMKHTHTHTHTHTHRVKEARTPAAQTSHKPEQTRWKKWAGVCSQLRAAAVKSLYCRAEALRRSSEVHSLKINGAGAVTTTLDDRRQRAARSTPATNRSSMERLGKTRPEGSAPGTTHTAHTHTTHTDTSLRSIWRAPGGRAVLYSDVLLQTRCYRHNKQRGLISTQSLLNLTDHRRPSALCHKGIRRRSHLGSEETFQRHFRFN